MEKSPSIFKGIAPMLFAIFVDVMGFSLVLPILTSLFFQSSSTFLASSTTVSMRSFYLSLAYLLYPFFMFFGASFLGDLSDKLGRKKVLLIALLGLSLAFAVLMVSVIINSLILLFIARGLSGLLAGSQPIAQASIADLSTPKNKARNLSYVVFINSTSFMIGPLVGGILSDNTLVPFFGFWTPFLFSSLLSLGTFFWIYTSYKDTFTTSKEKARFQIARPLIIFSEAFTHKAIRLLGITFILMQLGIGLFMQYILVFLHTEYHYSSFLTGIFFAFIGLFFAIGLLVILPILVKYFVIEKLIFWCFLLTGFGLVVIFCFRVQMITWIFSAWVALTNNIAFSLMMTTFSNQVDESRQGWVMGIFWSAVSVAFILAGAAANLIPLIGAIGVILLGGILYFVSSILIYKFNQNHTLHGPNGPIEKQPTK